MQQKSTSRYAFWWGHLGLNQGPIGYEPTALTTELCPHALKYNTSDKIKGPKTDHIITL